MLQAVAAYLEARRVFPTIYIDYMPDQPDECVGLFCWDHTAPTLTDGTSTRFVQIRVRGTDLFAVMNTCQAMVDLLDSGPDESPLPLNWPGAVIGHPRRMPAILDRDARTVTVYAEIALWGET